MLLKRDSLKYIFIYMQVGHGQRHLFKQYSLKTRRFIGNTSMDPQLSFLMANQGQVYQYILRHKTTAFFDGLNCPQQDLVVIITWKGLICGNFAHRQKNCAAVKKFFSQLRKCSRSVLIVLAKRLKQNPNYCSNFRVKAL